MNFKLIITELAQLSDPTKAKQYATYYKTGKGQYSEGAVFLGIATPVLRKITKNYFSLPLDDVQELLNSNIHTHRFVALLILVEQYKKTKSPELVSFYLNNTYNVNNWDLVDSSAHQILGKHLTDKDRTIILTTLAKSNSLWERRIAIVATYAFIRRGEFDDTLRLAELLLHDRQDLIHKAVGWMLREVGKKEQTVLEQFLDKHARVMPRTMLRYAIEKFEENKRKKYLKKKHG